MSSTISARFRNITTFAVYVTGCDLKKSFSFEMIVEITSHKRFPIDNSSFSSSRDMVGVHQNVNGLRDLTMPL